VARQAEGAIPVGEKQNMPKDISFTTTDGTTLRGWHYTPDTSGKHPTIIMAHGFSAVKEMYLDKYAEHFARAGLASVVYDNRNFGASDGAPRQEIDPWLQVRDYSDAITFAQSLDQTDPKRIGVWGVELQWRSCACRRRNRQTCEMRRLAGSRY
jgi:uncharacterized protein